MEAKRCQLRASHSTSSSCGCCSDSQSPKEEKKTQKTTQLLLEISSWDRFYFWSPIPQITNMPPGAMQSSRCCKVRLCSPNDCAHHGDWTHSYTEMRADWKADSKFLLIIWSPTFKINYFILFLLFFSNTKPWYPLYALASTVFMYLWLFFAAHTPDNSFLGFVVEQHLNASDIKHIDDIKRQNQSLVYGKVDNFWKVR